MNFCIERYLRIKSSPIKTNFLEAVLKMKIFQTEYLCNSSFRSFYPCGLSKLNKKLRGCQRGAHILLWQRVWIMKLLHDYVHDPLKQTKRTLWCFARLTVHSVSGCFRRFSGKFLKQTERLKRHSPTFLFGNFQAEVRSSCLQTFFEH